MVPNLFFPTPLGGGGTTFNLNITYNTNGSVTASITYLNYTISVGTALVGGNGGDSTGPVPGTLGTGGTATLGTLGGSVFQGLEGVINPGTGTVTSTPGVAISPIGTVGSGGYASTVNGWVTSTITPPGNGGVVILTFASTT